MQLFKRMRSVVKDVNKKDSLYISCAYKLLIEIFTFYIKT